jgi:hypothetical protein
MSQTISAQVVTNLTGEVFDVVGTSRNENYAFLNQDGLTNPVTTDWDLQPGADVANFNLSTALNVKAITERYNGYPDTVAKLARNIAVIKGPADPLSARDWSQDWSVINKDTETEFIRLDNNATFAPQSLVSRSDWTQWKSRFKGSFDAAGFPTAAFESSLTQIAVIKRQFAQNITFTGFSPVMAHTGEVLATNLGETIDNLVFYLKDTTSATNRFSRRGSTLFCRVEVENYNTEYTCCSLGFQAKAIEHLWVSGNKIYILVLAANGDKYTFASAPYPPVLQESAQAAASTQSVLYSQVVVNESYGPEDAEAEASIQSVLYSQIVVNESYGPEDAEAEASIQSVLYNQVVVNESYGPEDAEAEASAIFVDYTFSPPSPPPTPPTEISTTVEESKDAANEEELVEATFSVQSLTLS